MKNGKTLATLAGVVLALAGLFAAFDLTGAGAAPSAASATIGHATCDAGQFNPTHFAIVPGQTVDCSVTGTGLAAGSYTVLVKSSAGGNVPVPGTVGADGTLRFSYTFDPAEFSASVCGTTSDVSVEGGAIEGQQQLFFGFAFGTNSEGECAVTTTTTTTTPTTTTTTEGTTTAVTTSVVTVPVTTTVTLPGTTTTTPGQTVTAPPVTTTVAGPTQTVTNTTTTTTPGKTKVVKVTKVVRVRAKAAAAKATAKKKAKPTAKKKSVSFPFTP